MLYIITIFHLLFY